MICTDLKRNFACPIGDSATNDRLKGPSTKKGWLQCLKNTKQ